MGIEVQVIDFTYQFYPFYCVNDVVTPCNEKLSALKTGKLSSKNVMGIFRKENEISYRSLFVSKMLRRREKESYQNLIKDVISSD